MLGNLHITKDWTLFLDRDGVINHEKKEDYIRDWSEFKFYEESLAALPLLAQKFNQIIITTNQKGIGKGLMTDADLGLIHQGFKDRHPSHADGVAHLNVHNLYGFEYTRTVW